MKRYKISNLDLRTLAIINEVHRTRSVSQAAENLELPQSTVSMNLARLRQHFNDPLFVRTAAGMEPTPHMTELGEMLAKAEDLMEAALSHCTSFDAQASNRKFCIGAPEIIRATALPPLIRRLRGCAPGVRLEVQDLNDETPRKLQSGGLDIAVGILPPMGPGGCQQRLYKERFVCAVRTNHPRIHGTLSLRQFEEELHLDIATGGSGTEILSRALETGDIERMVSCRVAGAFGVSSVLKTSDCIAIVPEQLGRILSSSGNIRLLALPLELPELYVAQYWHQRYSHDPGNKWLRQIIAELLPARKSANADSPSKVACDTRPRG